MTVLIQGRLIPHAWYVVPLNSLLSLNHAQLVDIKYSIYILILCQVTLCVWNRKPHADFLATDDWLETTLYIHRRLLLLWGKHVNEKCYILNNQLSMWTGNHLRYIFLLRKKKDLFVFAYMSSITYIALINRKFLIYGSPLKLA